MGEVYKARDTRLERTVAIKVGAAKFSERFEREARGVAALNHPNICTLHDVGADYLVMEYVDGATVSGPMPVEQALKLAIQIAGALEEAYFWRTGQRWSADYRPHTWRMGPRVLRALFLLFAAYLVTAAILFLSR
jgi:serine/threonine protein kinase